jgi:hypothetical protein
VAKTRKTVRKSGSTKKAAKASKSTGAKKKSAGKTRGARKSPLKELDLRPLKKQLKAHLDSLGRARTDDQRVQGAIASLRRLQAELNTECDPTMTIPLA